MTENKCLNKNLYIMFILALFIIDKKCKQPKCPLSDELIKKKQCSIFIQQNIQPYTGTEYQYMPQHG